MSELRPPKRWLDESGGAPSAFVEGARGFHTDQPSARARTRIWEKIERDVAAHTVSAGWRVPWRGMGAWLLVGAGITLGVQGTRPIAAPAAHDAAPREPSAATAAANDPALVERVIEVEAAVAVTEPAVIQSKANIRATRREPANKPRPQAARHNAAQPTGADEVSLLVRARRLLHSQPERALALTARHAAAYPHGVFAEERELLAIEALSQLGRRELADQRIARFLASFPSSAHGSRVVALRSRD